MSRSPSAAVVVEKLVSNGAGLARTTSGQIVFVPGALPGERLAIEKAVKKKGVLWAQTWKSLRASPLHRKPACRHYTACGGCQLLELGPQARFASKVLILKDSLRRLAKQEHLPMWLCDFPNHHSRWRGKFHISAKTATAGFRKEGSHRITAIGQCRVLAPPLASLSEEIGTRCGQTGFEGDVFFAMAPDGKAPVLECRGSRAQNARLYRHLKHQPLPVGGVLFSNPAGTWQQRLGDPFLRFAWQGLQVSMVPSQFFQSNPMSWPVFFQWTRHYLSQFQPQKVWDVHAGSGFLTSCLQNRHIIASESHRAAAETLAQATQKANWNCRVFAQTAESLTTHPERPLHQLEGAILDPPRAGLSKTLRQWLLHSGPPSLLYFSCDTATFCRDLATLLQSYAVVPPLLVMNVNPATLRLELGIQLRRREKGQL